MVVFAEDNFPWESQIRSILRFTCCTVLRHRFFGEVSWDLNAQMRSNKYSLTPYNCFLSVAETEDWSFWWEHPLLKSKPSLLGKLNSCCLKWIAFHSLKYIVWMRQWQSNACCQAVSVTCHWIFPLQIK